MNNVPIPTWVLCSVDQEPVTAPITLHDAMARALKYNLEARLKVMEKLTAQRQLDLSTFDMLPKMAAEAGYVTRSNVSASSSESVLSGTTSLRPSTSQDRNRRVAKRIAAKETVNLLIPTYSKRH